MCYDCYEKLGKPAIESPVTKAAAKAIARVYEDSCVGGKLHIVIDDWNLKDDDIRWCIDNNKLTKPESDCAELLLKMTMDERASALAIYEQFIESKSPTV